MPWGPGSPEAEYSWGVLGGGAHSMLGGKVVEMKTRVITQKVLAKKWGFIEVLYESRGYGLAKLYVKARSNISLQKHLRKHELYWTEKGEGVLLVKDGEGYGRRLLRPGSLHEIPPGTVHQMMNTGDEALVILEAYTGEITDVVRVDPDPDVAEIQRELGLVHIYQDDEIYDQAELEELRQIKR